MNSIDIFSIALGLEKPWKITKVDFIETTDEQNELHLTISHEKGYKFSDSE